MSEKEGKPLSERYPWLIVPILLGAFFAIIFGTPVIAHFAEKWWQYWLPR